MNRLTYYVYVLPSLKDGLFYIGYTSNLERRMCEHDIGGSISTKSRMPFRLIYYEAFLLKNDALKREGYFKTTQGKKGLKLILRNIYKEKQSISFKAEYKT